MNDKPIPENLTGSGSGFEKARYPLAESITKEVLDAEVRKLEELKKKPLLPKLWGYIKLGGPGFMGASLTLGGGTLTAAMVSGSTFGYKMMWIVWLAMGLGLFMMAAMARFTCKGDFTVIQKQNEKHGWVIGTLFTAIIGTALVAVAFNFAQVALGTHLIESLARAFGFSFPQSYNWIVYLVFTMWIALSYGREGKKGIRVVENFMKWAIAVMLLCFGACLIVVGIDWKGALNGIFVPWLPSGGKGIDVFIAASSAAIGVIDWVFFHYTGLARGWGKKHEKLARFDFIGGLFLPFVLVNFIVICVFARTLYVQGASPDNAQELARALMPLLGEKWSQVMFYFGFLAVPITTTIGMSLAGAMAIHEAFNWKPDTSSWRWKICILLPQMGCLAVFFPDPLGLVITIAAFLSLTNIVVGWSFYLLINDKSVMKENRSKSYLWNLGMLLQITLLNAIAITYVLNQLGLWIK